eukprot:4306772-Amphidinium_carterae.1
MTKNTTKLHTCNLILFPAQRHRYRVDERIPGLSRLYWLRGYSRNDCRLAALLCDAFLLQLRACLAAPPHLPAVRQMAR